MFAVIPLLLVAYLIGSLLSAVLVSRLLDLPDPRHVGSENPGTTNVLRVGGKKAAIYTFSGDFLKGLLPVVGIHAFLAEPLITVLVGIAIVLGHLFPVFFGYKGGKGVATVFGVLIAYAPPVALATVGVWLCVLLVTRYVSLASVLAALAAPFFAGFVCPLVYVLGISVLSFLVIWRHYGNLQRLRRGQETRLGRR